MASDFCDILSTLIFSIRGFFMTLVLVLRIINFINMLFLDLTLRIKKRKPISIL
jgi:hypothetical protein